MKDRSDDPSRHERTLLPRSYISPKYTLRRIATLTTRPRAWRHRVTWGMFFLSHRSTVWKHSDVGTPYFLAASENLSMFCINAKPPPFLSIFLIQPGISLFIRLKQRYISLENIGVCHVTVIDISDTSG